MSQLPLPPPPSEAPWQPSPGSYSDRYAGPRVSRQHIWGCLGAGGVLVLVGIVAGGILLGHGSRSSGDRGGPVAVPIPTATPTPPPITCPPQPCVDAAGNILAVRVTGRDLRPDPADSIDPGYRLIALEVTFRNRTNTSKIVFTSDLVLHDGAGPPSDAVFSRNRACGSWERVDMAPGETAAPRTMCYIVRPRAPGPLTLSWTPPLLQQPFDIPLH